MANVFTKRSKIPRSTTIGDYGYRTTALKNLKEDQKTWNDKDQRIRTLASPTRRQNPQPVGLVYQSPYNRFGNVFGIWDANPTLPLIGCHHTIPHIYVIRKRQFVIPYGKDSIQRTSYSWPDEAPNSTNSTILKKTRNGYTPRSVPAVGIAPNVIINPSNWSPERDDSGHLQPLYPSARPIISEMEQAKISYKERIWKEYNSMLEQFRRAHHLPSSSKDRVQETRLSQPPVLLRTTENNRLIEAEN